MSLYLLSGQGSSLVSLLTSLSFPDSASIPSARNTRDCCLSRGMCALMIKHVSFCVNFCHRFVPSKSSFYFLTVSTQHSVLKICLCTWYHALTGTLFMDASRAQCLPEWYPRRLRLQFPLHEQCCRERPCKTPLWLWRGCRPRSGKDVHVEFTRSHRMTFQKVPAGLRASFPRILSSTW